MGIRDAVKKKRSWIVMTTSLLCCKWLFGAARKKCYCRGCKLGLFNLHLWNYFNEHTEWFSPVVLKGNRACVDLAKRETIHWQKVHLVTVKTVFAHDSLPVVILFHQMRKQKHFSYGCPDIIFLNGASLWSQKHTGVLGQDERGILTENNHQLQEPG